MRIEGKNTLVTGAGGFIGSHLVGVLVRAGARVKAFVRYNSRSDVGLIKKLPEEIKGEIEVFPGDLKDPEALKRPMRGSELVFHLGSLIAIPYSYINPMDFVQTNVAGTANLLHACLSANVAKIVHMSTSEVYGTAVYCPINEEHPLQAQSPYSATKIAADKLAESYYRTFGLPIAIARPFNTYGPRQSVRAVIPTIILQALRGDQVMLGSLSPTRDLNYVEDTVRGLVDIAKTPESVGEVINIGSGKEISIGDLARKIFLSLGKKVEICAEDERIRPANSEVARLVCDNSKAKRLLGWEPHVSLQDGLEKTVRWFESHGGEYRSFYAV
ncbi:MAG: GDP-mannose 4,6-dehydratase [Thermodesulfobacteriota bacterium]|nr:GDP-mannose 4,6-dehydratase [Thermodesulfobacteriota bacterium]